MARRKRTKTKRRFPTRKISETILDFGEPLLAKLGEDPPIEVVRNTVMLVILVWNANVLAEAGEREHLDRLEETLESSAPPEISRIVAALGARRLERFAHDPRVVGDWEVTTTGPGGFALRCEARLAQEA